jgi:hypothetical protein
MSKVSQYKKDLAYLKTMGCKVEKVTRVSFSNGLEVASGMSERQTIAYAAGRHKHLMKIIEATYRESHKDE